MRHFSSIGTSGQLGPILKQLRLQKGLSQAALGSRIGLSQERISRIESRPEAVTVDQILTVLMALDATFRVEPRATVSGQTKAADPAATAVTPGEEESW